MINITMRQIENRYLQESLYSIESKFELPVFQFIDDNFAAMLEMYVRDKGVIIDK